MEDYEVTIVEPLSLGISVSKSALPTNVSEPGGTVTFTVQVSNIGLVSVDLISLTDDIHDNLNGQGTCSVPQTIAAGGSYSCSFDATVIGNAGELEIDTVTAIAEDAGSNSVNANASATVTVTDVAPTISVTKTASPTSVSEPGGSVSFTVLVSNNSAAESVQLTALTDDIHGNLNGKGDCAVPRTIAASGSYQCSFSAMVSGNAGDTETDTVTATAEDDESNSVPASDAATVMITDLIPTIDVKNSSFGVQNGGF